MRFLNAFDISASGMTAQRLRMDVISNNLANVNTTRTPQGGPYRRQMVIFEARTPSKGNFKDLLSAYMEGEGGVRVKAIREDTSPFKRVYDPGNPDADQDGYVNMPNVNVVSEMVDMISATRAYEANVSAVEATKSMAMKALEIGR
ncbi:MAG TPA: flagellar basal body rod protein FlgC [Syntrophothermus lipocalidus]|uniref:Flagellar basal-body rod protein FlgC n=1 Tax=Syntrophothermus lipocalidus (strain DSM 12680 / TGB-C1) TaxID=643648 RepID=D7CLZ5_SYNLT|nr:MULTISPECIES: flagellar basal body rod protein FlgC [Syntrophothermus]ADI01730.1 flagellar basal-body rod protein FlgC [Syntrophothermus lipocalidus DSM 12680]NSW82404.1 flagellar basal body rod protein FlgC [Syntrophothermus sp.]HHV77128.1 flagellar basal body rod protein FlgC [Syntrophothermus lipocalidus]HOV66229.1 flagellar basal body rod protein FlgC [Bacillota bacterium]